MSEKTATRTREKWVDDVKVIACILVVLGHFFQSMTKSNILPENGLYQWFNTTIYYFHVPLFFICSGYLYQKYSKVNSVGSWCKNVAKKALALGVPYATFTTATWVLKKVFSSSVNDQIGGLGDTLFLHPTAPYWYLSGASTPSHVLPQNSHFQNITSTSTSSYSFFCTTSLRFL